MLFNYKQWRLPPRAEVSSVPVSQLEGFARGKEIIRRQFATILQIVICVNLLVAAYLFWTQPKFTAAATVIIDTRKGGVLQQQSMLGEVAVDTGMMDTQVEIIKSEKISSSVIKDLHLIEDEEFVARAAGITRKTVGYVAQLFDAPALTGFFNLEKPISQLELEQAALIQFMQSSSVKRIGLTYMIEINFTSLDAAKAARIANAIAETYIEEQVEKRIQTTRRATVWLQDRIKELSSQVTAEAKVVAQFKEKNNLVDTNGRLMIEQQLSELNSQLTLARTATGAAQARLERIKGIMQQEVPDQTVADALGNSIIVRLRGQYLDLKTRASTLAAKYGEQHLAVIELQNQKRLISAAIFDELGRISEGYQSDFDIAKSQEEAIIAKMAALVTDVQSSNRTQIELRELEISAQSYRTLYDSFVQRYAESIQQLSFPFTDTRVMNPATPPWQKSHPKTFMILGGALGASLILGFGVAMIREL